MNLITRFYFYFYAYTDHLPLAKVVLRIPVNTQGNFNFSGTGYSWNCFFLIRHEQADISMVALLQTWVQVHIHEFLFYIQVGPFQRNILFSCITP